MEAGWKFPVVAGAGSRLCPSLMPAGGLTPTVAVGFGPIAAGIGNPIIPGAGRLSTMADGIAARFMDGFGRRTRPGDRLG